MLISNIDLTIAPLQSEQSLPGFELKTIQSRVQPRANRPCHAAHVHVDNCESCQIITSYLPTDLM
jgi:hypothetical protein